MGPARAAAERGVGAERVYGLHGLRIRSAVPIVGFAVAGDDHDVHIRWSVGPPVPAGPPAGRPLLRNDPAARYLAADDGTRLTLRVPTLCEFEIERLGRDVHARCDPEADERLVAVLVSGLLVSFLLSLAGSCVLHASAVEEGGLGVAFAGRSGTGKSTLAALLCGAGARLITDDVLRVAMEPGPVCVGGAPQLRLRPGGTWALDGFGEAPPTRTTVDRRLAVTPAPAGDRPPLAAVVLPRLSRTADRIELRPLRGGLALMQLAACSRVVGWTDPEIAARQFQATAELAAAVPVVEATLPWGPGPARWTAVELLGLAVGRR